MPRSQAAADAGMSQSATRYGGAAQARRARLLRLDQLPASPASSRRTAAPRDLLGLHDPSAKGFGRDALGVGELLPSQCRPKYGLDDVDLVAGDVGACDDLLDVLARLACGAP